MIRKIRLSGAANRLYKAAVETFEPQTLGRIMQRAGDRAGVKAEEIVSPYPPPSGKPLARVYTRERVNRKTGRTETYLSKFASLKQQKAVMAKAARGEIPYSRTGKLGQSITSKSKLISVRRVGISIGSNRTYAPWVIGSPPRQSRYHAGTWTPLADDIDRNLKPIRTAFVNGMAAGIREELDRRT